MAVNSLSLCARITLDLHSLNNEGTEGNQQQTRMVHIIDQRGRRAVVNGISGDMFKHILVEHLVPLLDGAGQPLSPGARVHDADRINSLNADFTAFCQAKKKEPGNPAKGKRQAQANDEEAGADEASDETSQTPKSKEKFVHSESEVISRMLEKCSLTDIAGALVTGGRAIGRKSVVEFGWVVGLPEDGERQPLTTTEQYFHVKYAPEGRGAAAGDDTVAGRQAIFHRPASSGVYALICNLDLYRIGLNDITRQYGVDGAGRRARGQALIHALAATLLKPTGAQRNTQNPHIVACEGAVAVSSVSLPAPTVSPLNDSYREEIEAAAGALNGIMKDGISVRRFKTLAEGVKILSDVAAALEVAGA